MWVDNNMVIASPNIVDQEKDVMGSYFEHNNVGNVTECIECKCERVIKNRVMRNTILLLVQSLQDKVNLSEGTQPPNHVIH